MGFTTSYWQKERWSRRAADALTSYERCWNPSLGNWDVNWRVGDQDCVRTAMKNLFKPSRSAGQTCTQIRKQFHGKRKLKLPFEPCFRNFATTAGRDDQLGRNALADSGRKDMRRIKRAST